MEIVIHHSEWNNKIVPMAKHLIEVHKNIPVRVGICLELINSKIVASINTGYVYFSHVISAGINAESSDIYGLFDLEKYVSSTSPYVILCRSKISLNGISLPLEVAKEQRLHVVGRVQESSAHAYSSRHEFSSIGSNYKKVKLSSLETTFPVFCDIHSLSSSFASPWNIVFYKNTKEKNRILLHGRMKGTHEVVDAEFIFRLRNQSS